MAKVKDDWRVLRHGPIEKLDENLWYVTGSLPGMSLKRVMTLAGTPELKRIIVSHHEPITDRPAEILHQIAAAL